MIELFDHVQAKTQVEAEKNAFTDIGLWVVLELQEGSQGKSSVWNGSDKLKKKREVRSVNLLGIVQESKKPLRLVLVDVHHLRP